MDVDMLDPALRAPPVVTPIDLTIPEENDPILETYSIFIKPALSTTNPSATPSNNQTYILQYPNRHPSLPYSASISALPSRLRIKPESAMVEVDIPMDVVENYDREKGSKWGEAMKKSAASKGGGSHGLPGGFGIGGAQPGRGRGRGDGDDGIRDSFLGADDEMYRRAVLQEKVLIKQTLGGQAVANGEGTPLYMIGTFKDDQLHLTPVDSIVQMRPQFHHIDAAYEQERLSRGRDATAPAVNTRAVHMTVKSGQEEDEASDERPMNERISAAQSEAWKNHKVVDEADEEAWAIYAKSLFAGVASKEDRHGGEPYVETGDDLKERLPKLETTLDSLEYLDEISGPRDPMKLVARIKKENEGEDREKMHYSSDSEDEKMG